jgi:hypothetical protein
MIGSDGASRSQSVELATPNVNRATHFRLAGTLALPGWMQLVQREFSPANNPTKPARTPPVPHEEKRFCYSSARTRLSDLCRCTESLEGLWVERHDRGLVFLERAGHRRNWDS